MTFADHYIIITNMNLRLIIVGIIVCFFTNLGETQVRYVVNSLDDVTEGNGKVMKQFRPIPCDPAVLIVENGISLILDKEAMSNRIELEADSNILYGIETKVNSDTLILRVAISLSTPNMIIAKLGVGSIKMVRIAKGSSIKTSKLIDVDSLTIEMDSGSTGACVIQAQNLRCFLNGGSDLLLKGRSQKIDISVRNASTLNARGFRSREADIFVTSSSYCEIKVKGDFKSLVQNRSELICNGKQYISTHSSEQ